MEWVIGMFNNINEYLSDKINAKYEYDPFFVDNALGIYELYDGFSKIKIEYKSNKDFSYIDGLDNINYALEFFKQYGLSKRLETSLNDGTIEFEDSHENYEDSYNEVYSHCAIRYNYTDIVVPNTGTIEDSYLLVHEFMHSLNTQRTYVSHLLTEFVSIYFELKYADYLMDKNISHDDIAKLFMLRYDDCQKAIKQNKDMTLLLGIYNTCGEVTEEIISEYDPDINIEALSKTDVNMLSRSGDYRYVMCTLLATYALYNNISVDDILKLNNKLFLNTTVMDLLEEVGIPLDNDLLIGTCKAYIMQEAKKLEASRVIK